MPGSQDRILRVNEHIKILLAEHLPQILELPPQTIVTITRVQTSRDLSHAKVFVMIFPDKAKTDTLALLGQESKTLRHEVAKISKMFRVPQLHFHLDATEEKGMKMDEILDSLTKKK